MSRKREWFYGFDEAWLVFLASISRLSSDWFTASSSSFQVKYLQELNYLLGVSLWGLVLRIKDLLETLRCLSPVNQLCLKGKANTLIHLNRCWHSSTSFLTSQSLVRYHAVFNMIWTPNGHNKATQFSYSVSRLSISWQIKWSRLNWANLISLMAQTPNIRKSNGTSMDTTDELIESKAFWSVDISCRKTTYIERQHTTTTYSNNIHQQHRATTYSNNIQHNILQIPLQLEPDGKRI